MKIEAHLICWNESEIIGMVISHYKKFCDHITIWDNFSSDETPQIAESMGCEVKKFGKKGELSDQAYLDVKNNAWKNSAADWVVMADCDEVLHYAGDIKEMLSNSTESVHRPLGWQIYSNEMPENEMLDITTGYQFNNYSKCVLFSPSDVKEMNYKPGAHICRPEFKTGKNGIADWTGNLGGGLYLLHYRTIGGVDRQIKRYKEYCRRMSIQNRRMGWGSHYWDKETILRKEWKERLAKSKPLL